MTFLASHQRERDQINQDFQSMNIKASIILSNESILISAVDKEEYITAIRYLSTVFITKSLTVRDQNLYLPRDLQVFEKEMTNGISECKNVYSKMKVDNNFQSCMITVTGKDYDVYQVLMKFTERINRYHNIKTVITLELTALKMNYVQSYIEKRFKKLLEQYHCDSGIEFNPQAENQLIDSEAYGKMQVTIHCPICHQGIVKEKISKLFNDITTEEHWNISRFSSLSRYLQNRARRKIFIESLQKEFQCTIRIKSDIQSLHSISIKHELFKIQNRLEKAAESKLGNTLDEIKINEITIKIVRGALEKIKADVIINSIELGSYSVGKLAKLLYRAGGQAYQNDCDTNLAELTLDKIGITDGSYFQSKAVYHIPFLSSNRKLPWLIDKINQCIKIAHDNLMTSIAIPPIGAGNVGLHIQEVARGMIDAAKEFALQNSLKTSLKTIYVTVSLNDHHTAFRQALLNVKSEIDLINNAIKSKAIRNEGNGGKLTLLYSARCCIKDQQILILDIYKGSIQHSHAKALLSLIEICASHLDGYAVNFQFHGSDCNSNQSLPQGLHGVSICSQDPIVIKACPYGMLENFDALLNYVNRAKVSSLAIPFLGNETDEKNIGLLISKIEEFVQQQHLTKNLQRLEFVMINWYRCLEMTRWIRNRMINCSSTSYYKWIIFQDYCCKPLDIDIAIAAKDRETIRRIKSKMYKLMPSLACKTLTDVEHLTNLEDHSWISLKLNMWNKYGTVLIKESSQEYSFITIYGISEDVCCTIIDLYQKIQRNLQEKASHTLQQFTYEIAPWQMKIGHSYYPFDEKLNYEIEKYYQLYQKDKKFCQTACIGGELKVVNFEQMNLTLQNSNRTYVIRKNYPDCISVPGDWEYDNINEIQDGRKNRVEITTAIELAEIYSLLGNSNIEVTQVERVQNWNLYQRYQLMKMDVAKIVDEYQPGTIVERQLFHGTQLNFIDRICQAGFNRDYSGKSNGAALGIGTYFTQSAEVAKVYGPVIIIARVLTGIFGEPAERSQPNLGTIQGSQTINLHSVRNENNDSVFVVFHDNAAYPEYIVYSS
ncbi:uncharacterized protein TRIADDRAFT_58758 [Trichoplax adhaerens]|uniref:Poly [ADP-ribose] polymerase n=1 Tax=Trichoplax adhaerens TaxID=10228 RepID=B3S3K7_TRIAD|nr:predicted protein [Trichoplax adhaerens]EDV22981.1 predicted protein [Trichoplax adhaerens]|eukprot:XP_002114847.1 predicted protein [Trichoplax adhaerens]